MKVRKLEFIILHNAKILGYTLTSRIVRVFMPTFYDYDLHVEKN